MHRHSVIEPIRSNHTEHKRTRIAFTSTVNRFWFVCWVIFSKSHWFYIIQNKFWPCQVALWDCSNQNNFEPFWGWKKTQKGKTTRHWLWRVKDIHMQPRSRTQAIAVRGERVTTAPPSHLSLLSTSVLSSGIIVFAFAFRMVWTDHYSQDERRAHDEEHSSDRLAPRQ